LVEITYSEELISDFKTLVTRNDKNLSTLASKHGFTRERARQIFELINGFTFTVIKKDRTAKREEKRLLDILKRRDPRQKLLTYHGQGNLVKGAISERRVLEICGSLGYEVGPFTSGAQIDLVINGYNVEVKSAHKSTVIKPKGKTPLYHFTILPSQMFADFVVCHAVPINKFFVIPRLAYPKSGAIYIPEKNKREWDTKYHHFSIENRYYAYLEAWNLLTRREEVIFCNPRHSLPASAVAI
jgi:hypothetical protein